MPGMTLTRNSARQPETPKATPPGGRAKLMHAAVMLPTAASAWRNPRAYGRDRAGRTSATNATAAPNVPPTPSPIRNR